MYVDVLFLFLYKWYKYNINTTEIWHSYGTEICGARHLSKGVHCISERKYDGHQKYCLYCQKYYLRRQVLLFIIILLARQSGALSRACGWKWIQMDASGYTWIHVDANEYKWMQVDTRGRGRKWMQVDANGCRWMQVDAGGWKWIQVDANK